MAGDARSDARVEPILAGAGLRVAVVCARFNDLVTMRLLEGARRGLESAGVDGGDIDIVWVPGALELPLAAQAHARTHDAVICLGCVIRGETSHYEIVAFESAHGIARVQLDTGVPVMFGVLTTENLDQALARSEDAGGHNVGEECATGAVEMVGLLRAARATMG